jgi:hypothetical protein
MSDPDDPECAALFEALGVGGAEQSLFRVEARAE